MDSSNKSDNNHLVQQALIEIQKGASIYKTAKKYNVSVTAVSNEFTSQSIKRPKPVSFLSKEEESALAELIRLTNSRYVSQNEETVYQHVSKFLTYKQRLMGRLRKNQPIDGTVFRNWFQNFMSKKKLVFKLKISVFYKQQVSPPSREEVLQWYSNLQYYHKINEKCLNVAPHRVFCMGEKDITINRKNSANDEVGESQQGNSITLLSFVHAVEMITDHPMPVLFHPEAEEHNYNHTHSSSSAKSQVLLNKKVSEELSPEQLHDAILKHFNEFVSHNNLKPVILYTQWNFSRFYPHTLYDCLQQDILLYGIPYNMTHIASPQHLGLFIDLEAKLVDLLQCIPDLDPSSMGPQCLADMVGPLYNETWFQGRRVSAAFRRSGLYPVNVNALDMGRTFFGFGNPMQPIEVVKEEAFKDKNNPRMSMNSPFVEETLTHEIKRQKLLDGGEIDDGIKERMFCTNVRKTEMRIKELEREIKEKEKLIMRLQRDVEQEKEELLQEKHNLLAMQGKVTIKKEEESPEQPPVKKEPISDDLFTAHMHIKQEPLEDLDGESLISTQNR